MMVGRRREFKVVYMFLLRRPTSSRTWGFRLGVRFEAGKCDQRRCRRCRRCRRARRRPRVWRRGQGCGGGEGWRRRCWVLRGVWRGNSLALLYCAAAMKRGAVVSLVTRQASPSSSPPPPPPHALCVSASRASYQIPVFIFCVWGSRERAVQCAPSQSAYSRRVVSHFHVRRRSG